LGPCLFGELPVAFTGAGEGVTVRWGYAGGGTEDEWYTGGGPSESVGGGVRMGLPEG